MADIIVGGVCFMLLCAVGIIIATVARSRSRAGSRTSGPYVHPFGRPMSDKRVPWTGRRFLGGPEVVDLTDAVSVDGAAQCPVSNACPMADARECERWGECYWEEQERKDGNLR